MLYRVSHIPLYLLTILYYSSKFGETLLPKENDKLSENAALQMCIDSFDIHKDKIIRTQDSQRMGAKYLNEVDLDSRQECLRLCCETDECDVFIFEEKKPGSCYLFHCGPPHDFKCKFTSHANYSSAVLTNINYRTTAQLEEQIRRTQQEHELKSLRKSAPLETAALEYSYTEAPPVPVTETPKPLVLTTQIPIKTGCSRNQYECRTSGDCIAIYNVCDGIPQCTDGSDEASELGCPTEKPTIPSSPVIHSPLIPQTSQVLKYPAVLPHHKSYPPMYGNEQENPSKLWPLAQIPPHQIIPQQPNLQYPGPQGMLSLPVNYGSQGYIGGWDYRQIYEQNKEAYNAANQLHAKNELAPYEQDQPHIFKHKSAGVVAQSVGPEPNSYIDSNRPYAPYTYSLQNHGAWQEGQPQALTHPPEPSSSPQPKLQQNRPITTQELPKSTTGPLPCKPSAKQINESPKEKDGEKKEHETVKTSSPKNVKNVDHITKPAVHESAQGSKKETRVDKTQEGEVQHTKTPEEHPNELRIHHYVAEHLQQNNHKTNIDILRPKGAVISLALGLTATAIMVALIACRLRVVRRRGRRGHGPYAHDADYLVNGMYL